jgi:UDP-N-acetylglucosamine 2-epimerase (non-hydrolysing)
LKRILLVVGTRPEAIKMLPILSEIRKCQDLHSTLYITGQHREMLSSIPIIGLCDELVVFDRLSPGQSQFKLLAGLIADFGEFIETNSYDLVLVQGDTSSAALLAWLSFLSGLKVWHVEAGLRTHDLQQPFPEEGNRRIITSIASFHFASTEMAKENLMREGVDQNSILVTGNTVIDAINQGEGLRKTQALPSEVQVNFDMGHELVLVTVHRRENLGHQLVEICNALQEIIKLYKNLFICIPVHPNPKVRKVIYENLSEVDRVVLLEPVSHDLIMQLIGMSHLVLTDSGGIQEETPSFRKPLLVLREKTERPEAVKDKFSFMAGTSKESIIRTFVEVQTNYSEIVLEMQGKKNPFGDGHAAERIVDKIKNTQL